MNREYVFSRRRRQSTWTRTCSTLRRWLWGALCCGAPGVPCYYCSCCDKIDISTPSSLSTVNRATATAERVRPRRPHAPGCRKSTPELLTAVKCALNQLQGEPAPPRPAQKEIKTEQDPG